MKNPITKIFSWWKDRKRKHIIQAIEVLNEAFKIDPLAVKSLFGVRISCNEKLADHETIQVQKYPEDKVYTVGLLGVINGIFGVDREQWGTIAASYALTCYTCGDVVEYLNEEQASLLTEGSLCPKCGDTLRIGHLLGFFDLGRDVGFPKK